MTVRVRWLVATGIAAAFYVASVVYASFSDDPFLPLPLNLLVLAMLVVAAILTGAAFLAERTGSRITAHIDARADAARRRHQEHHVHEDDRFDSLTNVVVGAVVDSSTVDGAGLSDNVRAFELGRRVSQANAKAPS